MKLSARTWILALTQWLTCFAASAAPVPIIFDTDMDTDCDDAGALAVLHALADRGECEILGTMVSVRHAGSAPTVAAINAYYGRPNLPLGNVKQGGVMEPSRYAGKIANEFPQPLKSGADAADATQIYRDLLERQPDRSVVIVTVGYLTNLRNLLELPASSGHPSGRDLAQRKVKSYVCMGGNFAGSPPKDDRKLGNENFTRDAASALHVIRHWPGPIVFVGREIGSVPSGLRLGASLEKTPPDNPVRRAYEHYFEGRLKNRHVADLVTVLYAVRGQRDYWDIQTKGHMDLHPDMTFEWKFDQDRQQAFLLKKKTAAGQPNDRYIESVLDALLIQPPRGARWMIRAMSKKEFPSSCWVSIMKNCPTLSKTGAIASPMSTVRWWRASWHEQQEQRNRDSPRSRT